MNASQQYEFDESQKAVIERLYGSMRSTYNYLRMTGILVGLMAVLLMVDCFREGNLRHLDKPVNVLAAALMLLVIGNSTWKVALSFHRLVTTSGQNITDLLSGLDKLREMYSRVNLVATIWVAVLAVVLVADYIVTRWGQ